MSFWSGKWLAKIRGLIEVGIKDVICLCKAQMADTETIHQDLGLVNNKHKSTELIIPGEKKAQEYGKLFSWKIVKQNLYISDKKDPRHGKVPFFILTWFYGC